MKAFEDDEWSRALVVGAHGADSDSWQRRVQFARECLPPGRIGQEHVDRVDGLEVERVGPEACRVDCSADMAIRSGRCSLTS